MQIRKENMELLKSLDFLNGYENAVENGKMTEEIKKQVLEHKDVNKELLSEMIEQYDVISKERAKMCRELEKSFLIELKNSIGCRHPGLATCMFEPDARPRNPIPGTNSPSFSFRMCNMNIR